MSIPLSAMSNVPGKSFLHLACNVSLNIQPYLSHTHPEYDVDEVMMRSPRKAALLVPD